MEEGGGGDDTLSSISFLFSLISRCFGESMEFLGE